MKATDLLQKQHRDIEQLLERLETAGPEDEKGLREALASLLVAHTAIEEEIFYPAVHRHAPDLVMEALEEHALADYELARDLGIKAGDSSSRAKATVLADVVVRHIRKEEAELFRKVDAAITNQELAELGEHMAQRFEEVRAKGFQRVLAASLAENAPRLAARPMARKATTRRAAPAKKKARGRAKAVQAKRAAARKPVTRPPTAKRGAKRSVKRGAKVGAKRGVKRGVKAGAKRGVKRGVKRSATATPKVRKTTRGTRAGAARAAEAT